MTREEQTIANLKKLKSFHNGSYGTDIDRAIKALEQEPSKSEKPNETDKEIHGVREELKAIEKELHNLNRILEKRKI